MREPVEFQTAARRDGIARWPIRHCSLCHYELAYVFEDGHAYFDAGCYCTDGCGIQARDWTDVAAHFNMQYNPEVVARYERFWFPVPTDVSATPPTSEEGER